MKKLSKREKEARARNLKRSRKLVAGWTKENRNRAANAERALRLYMNSGHDIAIVIRNLLSDLRHYCDARNVNFVEQDGIAARNYVAEVLELR